MKDRIGGYCPVQGFGAVGDLCWYFRARGERWELRVGQEDPDLNGYVDVAVWTANGFWGEAYDAGWMPHATAMGLVWEGLRRYLAGEKDWQAPDDIGWEEYGIYLEEGR